MFMIGFLVGVSTSGILFLGLAWRGDSWFGLVAVRLWAGLWLLLSCIGGFGFGWVFGV